MTENLLELVEEKDLVALEFFGAVCLEGVGIYAVGAAVEVVFSFGLHLVVVDEVPACICTQLYDAVG